MIWGRGVERKFGSNFFYVVIFEDYRKDIVRMGARILKFFRFGGSCYFVFEFGRDFGNIF